MQQTGRSDLLSFILFRRLIVKINRFFCLRKQQKDFEKKYENISTHLLTVLIMSVILRIEHKNKENENRDKGKGGRYHEY